MDTRAVVIKTLSEQLKISASSLSNSTELKNELGLKDEDIFGLLFVVAFEIKYDFNVTMKKIPELNLVTIGDIVKYIDERRRKK